MVGEAFLLGLSTGTYCVTCCAPVVLPFIFSEEMKNAGKNAMLVVLFMAGRLLGYITVGFILGALGSYAVSYINPELQRKFSAFAYTLLGLILLLTGLMYNFPKWKICRVFKSIYKPERSALVYGLLTGLNFCPPFFVAAARVFGGGNILHGMLYFLMFYIGTSVYFLPLFGVHFLKKHMETIRLISRLTMILLGVYFLFFRGFFSFI